MYELVNIFDSFLPQLLTYPNPADPLNIEAANLMNTSLTEYEAKVKSLVKEHAMKHCVVVDQSEKIENSNHKYSTDVDDDKSKPEQMALEKIGNDIDILSNRSDLSSLSDTSDICDEDLV
jgi:ubiquitin-conjugating enzyme E2 H